MSFDIVCESCGAPSTPSVGVCPYCKSAFGSVEGGAAPIGSEKPGRMRLEGRLREALAMATLMEKHKGDEVLADLGFLLDYSKILFESEGPSSKIRSLLERALLLDGGNREVGEYLDLCEAKRFLKADAGVGEAALKSLLRRAPSNEHALFTLAAHLVWGRRDDFQEAIALLERCLRAHPKFLRAWACLGAACERSGNAAPALNAYRKCLELESEPTMRKFLQQRIDQIARLAAA